MTAQTPTPTNSGWIVTGQTEQTQMGRAGTFVPGFVVYFTTNQGHTGSVFVENARYTPDNVTADINVRADSMDAIGQLSSGS